MFIYCTSGVGNGLIYTPSFVVISFWFDRRRSRATSLSLMWDGLGSLALAPLLQILMEYYGYTGTMLILAGFTMHFCITAALYRSPDKGDIIKKHKDIENDNSNSNDIENDNRNRINDITDTHNITYTSRNIYYHETNNVHSLSKQHSPDDVQVADEPAIDKQHTDSFVHIPKTFNKKLQKYIDYHIFKNVHYLAYSLLVSSGSLCFSMCNTHVAGLSKENGLTAGQIALLLGIMGAANSFSKAISGIIFDLKLIRKIRSYIFFLIGVIIGLVLMILPYAGDITSLFILWAVYMSMTSIFNTQETIILSDIVSRQSFPSAMGMSRFSRGLGVLVGPTFGGK